MPGTLLIGDWKKSVEDELSSFASGLQQKFQVIGDTPPPSAPAGPDPGIILQQLQGHAEQVAQRAGETIAQTQQVGKQLQDYASGLIALPQQEETPAPTPSASTERTAASDYRSQVPAAARATLPAGASVPGWLQDLIQRNAPEDLRNDPEFIKTVAAGAKAESGWDVNSVQRGYQLGSGAGARGLFQFDMGGMGSRYAGREQELLGDKGAELQAHDIVPLYAKAYRSAPAGLSPAEKASWVAAQAERPKDYTDPNSAARRGYANAFGEIASGVGGAVQAAGRAVPGPVGQALEAGGKQISQFGDAQLTNSEAYAACGPAAAVRFAQRLGRNPTLKEALDLAKDVGWTQQQGMAGISSQKALMDKLGVATKLVPGAQWDTFAREAQSGNPVTISTSAHYFYADGYDPGSGAFHVGRSGTDLRGGKEWMTRAEIEGAAQRLGGGNVQGALFADSPLVPSKSQAVEAAGVQTTGTGAPMIEAGDEASEPTKKPLQIIGDAPRGDVLQAKQVGQAFSDLGTQVQERVSGFTAPTVEGLGETAGAVAANFTAPGGPLEEITKPRLTGVGDWLKEELPNAPVLGGALGIARSALMPTDEELLQQARPSQLELARDYASLFTDDPTDDDVARALRGLQSGEALAGAAVSRAARNLDYDALARLRRSVPTPPVPSGTASWPDRIVAYTVNNVLSNPASLLANAAGGAVETIKRPVVTAGTAGVELVTGRPRRALAELGAAGTDLRATGSAIGDALSNGWTTLTTGRRMSRAADQPEAFEGAAGAVVTPFLRGMGATDEVVHTLSSAGAQGAEVARRLRANPGLSFDQVMSQFQAEILAAGRQAGDEATFLTGPRTGAGEAIAQARSQLTAPGATAGQRVGGLVANVLAPFSSVPDVLLIKGARRIPGINEIVTVTEAAQAAARGDTVAMKRAAASGALATMVNAAIWAQVQEGNITGSGPEDAAKRRALMQARDENGNPLWRPNSIRAGDQWIPYSSLGPVAVQLGAVANGVEQYEYTGREINPNYGTALAKAMTETITEAWYLQTVEGVFDAIRNEKVPEWMGTQALSTATRAIPDAALWNQFRGISDPTMREPKPKLEDPATWAEYFANRLPGVSETVRPRLDPATGRPMEEPRTIGSALVRGTATGEPNPVNEVLARHNMGVGDAPKTISPAEGLTIAITEEERRRFTELAGPEVEKNVLLMSEKPSFQRAPLDLQKDLLQDMISISREAAALKLWQTLPRDEQRRRLAAYEQAEKRGAEPVVRLPAA